MAEKLKIDMNVHKLDALKVGMHYAGKNFQTEINKILDELYAEYVSEEEQAAVNEKIYQDSLPNNNQHKSVMAVCLRKPSPLLSVFGLFESGNLYSLASICKNLQEKAGRVAVGNAEMYMARDCKINETTFNVLADSVNKDARVKGVYDFDFDNGIVRIKECGDQSWISVYLEDVIKACEEVGKIEIISPKMQETLFAQEIRKQAIVPICEEEVEEQDDAQTLQTPV